jgi:membrane associated rhomboid family serine protease
MLPLADTAKEKGPTVITTLLIVANAAVFAWEIWLGLRGGRGAVAGFMVEHALVPRRLLGHLADARQWETLVSHMFLHGGAVHLLGNLWFLAIFGGNVENRLGSARFLGFYLLAGAAAAAAQMASGPFSAVPMVGASGAISGVMGAYLVFFPTAWVWTLVPWIVPIVPVPAAVFLVVWFALQAVNGLGALLGLPGATGGVAWWAHAGGFAAGAAMAWKARNAGGRRRRK